MHACVRAQSKCLCVCVSQPGPHFIFHTFACLDLLIKRQLTHLPSNQKGRWRCCSLQCCTAEKKNARHTRKLMALIPQASSAPDPAQGLREGLDHAEPARSKDLCSWVEEWAELMKGHRTPNAFSEHSPRPRPNSWQRSVRAPAVNSLQAGKTTHRREPKGQLDLHRRIRGILEEAAPARILCLKVHNDWITWGGLRHQHPLQAARSLRTCSTAFIGL